MPRRVSLAEGRPPEPYETVPDVWRPDDLPGKRGFDVARAALGSKVESVVGLDQVRWLVCSHQDPDIIGALDDGQRSLILFEQRGHLIGVDDVAQAVAA